MSYQFVRGTFESIVGQSLVNAGVDPSHVFFDNVGETPPGSEIYATVSLSFTDTSVDTLSCESLEYLRGSLSVNVYTPKNKGSKSGEDICLEVQRDWQAINRWHSGISNQIYSMAIRNIEGPFTIAPDSRPVHVNNVACTWQARVGDTRLFKYYTDDVLL